MVLGKTLQDLGTGKDFLNRTPGSIVNDVQMEFLMLKGFVQQRKQSLKENLWDGRKPLLATYFPEGLYLEYTNIKKLNKNIYLTNKWTNEMNR